MPKFTLDFDRGRIIASKDNRRISVGFFNMDHRRHPVPSRETIRRRLTEVGLRSRRPLRRAIPLTPHHRQCRLDFCRPRQLEV
ncbi:hypothetical protein TNCV_3845351 [Trichonephila clavipes]|nr:hypothetical protein TNCV_3845351 [Trichonephila clavipes]